MLLFFYTAIKFALIAIFFAGALQSFKAMRKHNEPSKDGGQAALNFAGSFILFIAFSLLTISGIVESISFLERYY